MVSTSADDDWVPANVIEVNIHKTGGPPLAQPPLHVCGPYCTKRHKRNSPLIVSQSVSRHSRHATVHHPSHRVSNPTEECVPPSIPVPSLGQLAHRPDRCPAVRRQGGWSTRCCTAGWPSTPLRPSAATVTRRSAPAPTPAAAHVGLGIGSSSRSCQRPPVLANLKCCQCSPSKKMAKKHGTGGNVQRATAQCFSGADM